MLNYAECLKKKESSLAELGILIHPLGHLRVKLLGEGLEFAELRLTEWRLAEHCFQVVEARAERFGVGVGSSFVFHAFSFRFAVYAANYTKVLGNC